MESHNDFPIDLGTRKLIRGKGTYLLTIPPIAIRTSGMRSGDSVHVFMNVRGDILTVPEEK